LSDINEHKISTYLQQITTLKCADMQESETILETITLLYTGKEMHFKDVLSI